jgi:hypothetical protein
MKKGSPGSKARTGVVSQTDEEDVAMATREEEFSGWIG